MTIPKNIDVLLINPPSGLFYGLGPNFAPMGLFYLAAVLRRQGFSVAVLNANYFPDYQTCRQDWCGGGQPRPKNYYYAEDFDNPVWEQVLHFVETVSPRLVGFSCHDLSVGGIKLLAGELKKRLPELQLATGGATPTGAPDIFSDCPALDYLLVGEGEETLLELTRSLLAQPKVTPGAGDPAQDIPGLWYRRDGAFTFTSTRAPISDLDSLPEPDRDYFWLDYAAGQVVADFQLNGLGTSRGCVKACRFCGARTIWPGPVRYRAIDKVLAEIAALRQRHGYDFQHFSIFDDDFLARPARVQEFCRGLKALGGDYKFRCYGRVNNLQDEEMVEDLFAAGCQEIWVGVESGSPSVLKAMGKGITVPQIERLDRLFKNYDFPWLAFIILGTPQEDESDIQTTLSMLRQGHFPAIQPFTFQPYTGTAMFEELRSAGIVGYNDIIKGHQNLPQFFSQKVPEERFFELFGQLTKLAEDKRASWTFAVSEEQWQKALAWEDEAAAALAALPPDQKLLVLGPESRVRWLAALAHYRGLAKNLRYGDLEAEVPNITRFGRITPKADILPSAYDGMVLVAAPDEKAGWLKRLEELAPALTIRQFTPDTSYWRPVFNLVR